MNTHNQSEILTVAIDLEQLLQGVYAESAWRKMCKIEENEAWVQVDADRRLLLMSIMREVFAKTCLHIGAYVKGNNMSTFEADGMLRLELVQYKALTDSQSMRYATLVEQYLLMQMLSALYVCDAHYAQRAKERGRALLSLFAADEQISNCR